MTHSQTVTKQVEKLLRIRHRPPEWAVFSELRNSTGYTRNLRSIDVYAFGLWPSGGFKRVAYEIKATRSDFIRELNNPEKRKPAEELANECYFAMPSGLVKVDEIPEGWGLIQLTKGGLRIKKRAMQRTIDPPPIQFVASILREADRKASDGMTNLSAITWTFAGKEIPADKLVEEANWEVKRQAERDIEKAKDAVMNSPAVTKYKDIFNIVRNALGYRATEPEALKEILNQKKWSSFNNWEVDELKKANITIAKIIGAIEESR